MSYEERRERVQRALANLHRAQRDYAKAAQMSRHGLIELGASMRQCGDWRAELAHDHLVEAERLSAS